ncbi:MAG TPA: hypothetical protein VGH54_29635 [Mycobacterium sp.]|jgi:hypothetical protein|uniref:hypothetical protein n=1 Tax=Mycobacterium sp. TaxID=1785 RepID=UPI002F3F1058
MESFTDKQGRTWPGPSTLDGREVTDVDTATRRVQVRVSHIEFEWVNPDHSTGQQVKRTRKHRKERA